MQDLEILEEALNDPVIFAEAFFRLPNDVTGDLEPVRLYPYQEEFLRDTSTKIIVAKSRQVGFSTVMAMKILYKALTRDSYNHLILSFKEDISAELLSKVKLMFHSMPDFLKPKVTKDQWSKFYFKSLDGASESRIIALPGNPKSARSFHGDVTFDEFAFIEDDVELLTSALSVAVRGNYQITIGSTGYGTQNEFYRILKECGWDVDRPLGSRDEYRRVYDQALRLIEAGMFKGTDDPAFKRYVREHTAEIRLKDMEEWKRRLIEANERNTSDWKLHVFPFFACEDLHYDRIAAVSRFPEAELQEFFIAFIDNAMNLFPEDLLKRVMYPVEELRVQPMPMSRVVMGIDPGGRVSDTAIVIMERVGNNYEMRYLWSEKKELEHMIGFVNTLVSDYNVSVIYVDETGYGKTLKMLLKDHVACKVDGIHFSNASKDAMMQNLAEMIDRNLIKLFNDGRLKQQLMSMRRSVTPSGLARYIGDGGGGRKKDDIVWALAMCAYDRVIVNSSSFVIKSIKKKRGIRHGSYIRARNYA